MLQIVEMQRSLDSKDKKIERLEGKVNAATTNLDIVNKRLNLQYNKHIDVHKLFKLEDNQYVKILYIKEISRVHYVDTLLYYLCEVIKTLYGEPVRQVVIAPFYAYSQAKLYDNFVPHWELSYQDVYDSNIYMAGLQQKLLNNILQNANHVHYLVILVRSMCDKVFLTANNMVTVYTASDRSDLLKLYKKKDLDHDHIISYDGDTLYIPYIESFQKDTVEERIKKYTSMDIMQKLLEFIEQKDKV